MEVVPRNVPQEMSLERDKISGSWDPNPQLHQNFIPPMALCVKSVHQGKFLTLLIPRSHKPIFVPTNDSSILPLKTEFSERGDFRTIKFVF